MSIVYKYSDRRGTTIAGFESLRHSSKNCKTRYAMWILIELQSNNWKTKILKRNRTATRNANEKVAIFSRPKSSEYFTEPSVLICSKDICAVPWESILGMEVHIIRALCVLSLISTKFSSGQNRRQAPLTMAFTLGKSGRTTDL